MDLAITPCNGGVEPNRCKWRETCIRFRKESSGVRHDFTSGIEKVSTANMEFERCAWHILLVHEDPLTLSQHGAMVEKPKELA